MSFSWLEIERKTWSHCDWRQSGVGQRPIMVHSLSQTKAFLIYNQFPLHHLTPLPPILSPRKCTGTEDKAKSSGLRGLFRLNWVRASALPRSPRWTQLIRTLSLSHGPRGARGGSPSHLPIFTVLTKYIIHCHLLSGSTCRGATAAKLIAPLMRLS